MHYSLALLACAAAFVPRRPQRPALSCAAKKPQPPATRELESLKVGERVSGPLVGKVFQGKRGVKAFLDVGCVGNNKKRINGMLRLPHYKQWRNGTDAYKRLTKELRDARRGKSVTAYVAAVHAASQQLVLEPFAKPRPPSLQLSPSRAESTFVWANPSRRLTCDAHAGRSSRSARSCGTAASSA